MRYTIYPYNLDASGNLTFVLEDSNGKAFYGDSYCDCIDKFLCFYGG